MARFVADAINFVTTGGNQTVAITPTVGELLVVIAANSGTTTDPTVTDDRAGTYTRINGCTKNTSADEMHIYVRDTPCQLAVSHTITMNVGGAGTGGGPWVCRVADMAKFGANAVRQSAIQSNIAGSVAPAPVFTRPVLTSNMVIGAVFNGTNPPTLTAPTGWSEKRDTGHTVPAAGIEIVTRDSGETGTTITWNTATTVFCSLVMELDSDTPTAIRRREEPPEYRLRMRWPKREAQDFEGSPVVPPPSADLPYPIVGGGYYPT